MGEPDLRIGQDVVIEGPVLSVGGQGLHPDAAPPGQAALSVRLGKKPARRDPRDLLYASYRQPRALAVAAEAHWGHGLPFGVIGNDQYGDCVEAAGQHALQVIWDRAAGSASAYVPTTEAALSDYSAIAGFNPADPATDQGTDARAACSYWKATGLSDGAGGRHKIAAYLAVRLDNEVHAREAVQYYGGLFLGLAMPVSAQAQTGNGPWDVTTGPGSAPGSWGGHAVICTGFDPEGLWCVTWGFLQKMSWSFYGTYADEAFVLLFEQWVRGSGYSPSGLAWGSLLADLNSL